jgi:hypothetical protein
MLTHVEKYCQVSIRLVSVLVAILSVPHLSAQPYYPPDTANWEPVYYQPQDPTAPYTKPSPFQFVWEKYPSIDKDGYWGWYALRNITAQRVTLKFKYYCESNGVSGYIGPGEMTLGPHEVWVATAIKCKPAYMDNLGTPWSSLHIYAIPNSDAGSS